MAVTWHGVDLFMPAAGALGNGAGEPRHRTSDIRSNGHYSAAVRLRSLCRWKAEALTHPPPQDV